MSPITCARLVVTMHPAQAVSLVTILVGSYSATPMSLRPLLGSAHVCPDQRHPPPEPNVGKTLEEMARRLGLEFQCDEEAGASAGAGSQTMFLSCAAFFIEVNVGANQTPTVSIGHGEAKEQEDPAFAALLSSGDFASIERGLGWLIEVRTWATGRIVSPSVPWCLLFFAGGPSSPCPTPNRPAGRPNRPPQPAVLAHIRSPCPGHRGSCTPWRPKTPNRSCTRAWWRSRRHCARWHRPKTPALRPAWLR